MPAHRAQRGFGAARQGCLMLAAVAGLASAILATAAPSDAHARVSRRRDPYFLPCAVAYLRDDWPRKALLLCVRRPGQPDRVIYREVSHEQDVAFIPMLHGRSFIVLSLGNTSSLWWVDGHGGANPVRIGASQDPSVLLRLSDDEFSVMDTGGRDVSRTGAYTLLRFQIYRGAIRLVGKQLFHVDIVRNENYAAPNFMKVCETYAQRAVGPGAWRRALLLAFCARRWTDSTWGRNWDAVGAVWRDMLGSKVVGHSRVVIDPGIGNSLALADGRNLAACISRSGGEGAEVGFPDGWGKRDHSTLRVFTLDTKPKVLFKASFRQPMIMPHFSDDSRFLSYTVPVGAEDEFGEDPRSSGNHAEVLDLRSGRQYRVPGSDIYDCYPLP